LPVRAGNHAVRDDHGFVKKRLEHRGAGTGDGRVTGWICRMKWAAFWVRLWKKIGSESGVNLFQGFRLENIFVNRILRHPRLAAVRQLPESFGAEIAVNQPFLVPRRFESGGGGPSDPVDDMAVAERDKANLSLGVLVRIHVGEVERRVVDAVRT